MSYTMLREGSVLEVLDNAAQNHELDYMVTTR